MKKKFISLVIVSSLLNGCLLSPTLVYANDIGTTTTITRNNTSDGYTIITQNDKQIISYQSVDSSSKNEDGFTASIDARFIDDKYSSEMTTLINLTGFMSSKKEDVIKKYNLHDVTNSTAINFRLDTRFLF
ncbi:beta-channel forming cytolysin [Clostridium perfringens]|uniref:Beta-channel forming cytolysin n=1 Tax=Clostridium perfringens TaxID=1502 RepID=A0A2X3IFQ0_CLOPF|nr:beta-channel forming cytolysin [Clostridium perfringens]